MTWKSNQLKKKDQIKHFVSTSFWPFEDVPVVIGEVTATHELWDLNGFWHGWNGQRGKTHTYLPWPCAHSGSTGTSQVTATYVDGNNIGLFKKWSIADATWLTVQAVVSTFCMKKKKTEDTDRFKGLLCVLHDVILTFIRVGKKHLVANRKRKAHLIWFKAYVTCDAFRDMQRGWAERAESTWDGSSQHHSL